MDRRCALKTLGFAGLTAVVGDPARAEATDAGDPVGILIDTTRCVGCRCCEMACAEANGLPDPVSSDEKAFAMGDRRSETQFGAVSRYETSKGEVFVKKQCMHCNQPACASACLTKAMYKTDSGQVIWRESKCMGCRFCMVSCPFDVPKFEYNSANPRLRKCQMCWESTKDGGVPACVENCPEEAVVFGKRSELLEMARSRIYAEPDRYVHHIYGEHEVGGTGVLYLAGVPFEELGFRTDLGTDPYPELTKEFLYAVPMVLALWPAFLLAVNNATSSSAKEQGGER